MPDTSTAPSKQSKWRNLEDFLKSHVYQKGTHPYHTHTKMKNEEEGIPGGSYYIPQEDIAAFHELYVNSVFVKNKKAHFTEKQLEKGIILVDLDFRYPLDTTERQHNEDDIAEIRDIYLDELKELYQFDETTAFDVVIMHKPNVNRVTEKNVTKDGIHLVITIPAKRSVQLLLRKRVLDRMKASEALSQLPIINEWEDVLDSTIVGGKTNWQMYGSCKPGNETYQITHWFSCKFDETDSEFMIQRIDPNTIDMKRDYTKISANSRPEYEPFLRLEAAKAAAEEEELSLKKTNSNATISSSPSSINMLRSAMNNPFGFAAISPGDVMQVKNREELNDLVAKFIDTTPLENYVQVETYYYLMILPDTYYGQGSYAKWIRAGWALRNLDPVTMFLAWVAFSAQSPLFNFSDIHDMWTKWNKPEDIGQPGGLTWRSVMYWAKTENPVEFAKIQRQSMSYYLDRTLDTMMFASDASEKTPAGCGDYDIATMLYQLKKGEYVCTSVKASIWYQFEKNRWIENDSGTSLRNAISTELRSIYMAKANELFKAINETEGDDRRRDALQKRFDKVMAIHTRLGKTNDKKNIMTEAKELFYDRNFQKNIDTNPYLLGFNNGVWDFKEKIFREGRPEDYLTKTTHIDYIESKDETVVEEIREFMRQLFPVPELETYMWEHLASTLIGVSHNQTFHNYLGIGRNGKSVLGDLMGKTLGDYKVDLTPEFLTSPRPRIGGLSPEIVKLRGVRYVCMNEPTKGSVLYEGPMKQLTSGLEPMECRAPFMPEMVEFIPQCKLVMMTNYLVDVHAQDEGTWRRIRVVDFLSWFTENPVNNNPEKPYQFLIDHNITEKFEKWKTVFMSMLVDKVLVTGGVVKDCGMVTAASANYRKCQDVINEFVSEKIVRDPESTMSKRLVSHEFTAWHISAYGSKGPKPKEVHDAIAKAFFKPNGNGWDGLRFKVDFEKIPGTQHVEEEDIEMPDF